jgi:hypothetical protein
MGPWTTEGGPETAGEGFRVVSEHIAQGHVALALLLVAQAVLFTEVLYGDGDVAQNEKMES